MFKLISAVTATIVSACDVEVDIPRSESGHIWSEGIFCETMTGGVGNENVTLSIDWQTGSETSNREDGNKWKPGYWIQNYAQWEDPLMPGKYLAVACNVEYDKDRVPTAINIDNYHQSESISVADNPRKFKTYFSPSHSPFIF